MESEKHSEQIAEERDLVNQSTKKIKKGSKYLISLDQLMEHAEMSSDAVEIWTMFQNFRVWALGKT